jgi:hypothetical protein
MTSSSPPDPTIPLEVQLTQDIAELDRVAQTMTDPAEALVLTKKANELQMRLSIILEQQGRPLAAQHFAEQRRRTRERP